MINYEEEVKKVYPGAGVVPVSLFGATFKYCIENFETGEDISKNKDEPSEAWESAYNNLKNKTP